MDVKIQVMVTEDRKFLKSKTGRGGGPSRQKIL